MSNAYQALRATEMVEAGLRSARPYVCKCGAQCLRGDDHDKSAMMVTVDVEPIDRIGEVLTIIYGYATYDIAPAMGKNIKAGTYHLHHRQSWHYMNPLRTYPVLRQHVCRKGRDVRIPRATHGS